MLVVNAYRSVFGVLNSLCWIAVACLDLKRRQKMCLRVLHISTRGKRSNNKDRATPPPSIVLAFIQRFCIFWVVGCRMSLRLQGRVTTTNRQFKRYTPIQSFSASSLVSTMAQSGSESHHPELRGEPLTCLICSIQSDSIARMCKFHGFCLNWLPHERSIAFLTWENGILMLLDARMHLKVINFCRVHPSAGIWLVLVRWAH